MTGLMFDLTNQIVNGVLENYRGFPRDFGVE